MPDRIATDLSMYHASRRGSHPGLVTETGQVLDYVAMDRRIGGVAAALRDRHGIRAGDRIGVLAENSSDFFVLQFAVQRIGAILVPFHLRATDADIRYMIELVSPRLILGDAAHADRALRCAARIPVSSLHVTPGPDRVRAGLVDANAISMLLFTSGTTGRPKAVQITNRMTVANAQNMAAAADITADTVFPAILPLYHSAGFNLYANSVFLAGGTVIVPRTTDAGAILWLLENGPVRPTHMFGVPTIYRAMADHPRFRAADLSGLQVAGVGGDAASPELLATWAQRGIALRHGYGMTEAGPAALAQDDRGSRIAPQSVGLPLMHVETRLVSRGRVVGAMESGELQVRGPTITPGYWRDATATTAAFDDGWLATGDLARRDMDGRYWIIGRLKEIIISGGENIHPVEIEQVLNAHPDVIESGVLGLADPKWGEVVCAMVRTNGCLDADALLAFCAERLPRFKLPKRFIQCSVIPSTSLGKVDRRELRRVLDETTAG
ncbi:MAG: class I adenylate-forming enzyme family protein [Pseudooceanicola nanhaiensis]|uniref:class I adenylate-forming enzyme family protein n=1 Tax=Rhodobacterales TaxID=204455 RepID=UPI0040581794